MIQEIKALGGEFTRLLAETGLWRLLAAFLVVFAVLVLRRLVVRSLIGRLRRLAEATRFRYDEALLDAVTPSLSGLFLLLGIFLAARIVPLPTEPFDTKTLVFQSLGVAAAVVVIYAFHRLSYVLADMLDAAAARADPQLRGQFKVVLRQLLSITTWIIGILLVVQNLGYSITSLLAGLGIGGLAVAFAAQETIANFFGSVMLLTDRPFKVGDWIQVGDQIDGDVEEIGFRSTKVRAWDKALISIPNKELASKIIKNWSRMPKRRVKQVIGVTYGSTPDQMQRLVQGIEDILRSDPRVHQEFILVKFTDFSAYSLDVLVYYFTVDTAWVAHLEARQAINLKIMELVKSLGLEFAFPTQTVHLVRAGDLPA